MNRAVDRWRFPGISNRSMVRRASKGASSDVGPTLPMPMSGSLVTSDQTPGQPGRMSGSILGCRSSPPLIYPPSPGRRRLPSCCLRMPIGHCEMARLAVPSLRETWPRARSAVFHLANRIQRAEGSGGRPLDSPYVTSSTLIPTGSATILRSFSIPLSKHCDRRTLIWKRCFDVSRDEL